MSNVKRNKKERESTAFQENGIIINCDGVCHEEKRKYTLLLKGLLVYLIVMGAMGCFLSSFNINYSAVTLHVIIFLCAMFCSMLYYNRHSETIGYIFLLFLVLFFGNLFRTYINSGFYAIANSISERAAVFFDTSAMRNYSEQVGNRYASVTISMSFIGCICCITTNIMVSRKMRFPFLSGVIMLIPMYLEMEPDILYVVMYVSALILVYIIGANGHYALTQNNNTYELQNKRKKITYTYAVQTNALVVAAVLIISSVLIGAFSIIFPKEQLKGAHTMSAIKKSTMDTVENISILGLMGLFNFSTNTGGLTQGTLGAVSSVRLDLQTDLIVEFAPYDDKRVYLKTFEGRLYAPYSNKWSPIDSSKPIATSPDETALLLTKRYDDGMDYSAKGVIKVTNVAAAIGVYLPYYCVETDKAVYLGRTQEYTYYPRVYEGALKSADEDFSQTGGRYVYEPEEDAKVLEWLYVPEENLEVIEEFVEKAGLISCYGNPQMAVEALLEYYQENIPYTLRPGMTPYRKDFINYFLAENKRGYCAHFASAATLIFRYLGIPAKYVEGYAIDPSDIAGRGTLLTDEEYSNYYDGFSPLNTNAVVSVEATDANAHAWVEVYDSEVGWIVADVTPFSYEEEPGESLWDRLVNFLASGQDSDIQDDEDTDAEEDTVIDEQTRLLYIRIFCLIATFIIIVLICRPLAKKLVFIYHYRNSDINGRLVMRYQNYIRKTARKNKELAKMLNYEEQINWLADNGLWKMDAKEAADCVKILEKAGFSQNEISETEFDKIVSFCRNM
ncbi:MAG: transglutaminase-like domain-containing protein [Clostridiales bacterium]|nr:transglutaminase-like domain-containing protein [Clostridiales bacterium]